MKTRKVTVNKCARCGNNHEVLEIKEFENSPIVDCNDITWNYWGICPLKNEPILFRIIANEKEAV